MSSYNINKGIGRTAEFKGLKAQYLMMFAAGLLSILLLVMVLYMASVHSYICILVALISSSLISYLSFHLNKKYGEHGLMKYYASKKHPRYIINRKPARKCFHVQSNRVKL